VCVYSRIFLTGARNSDESTIPAHEAAIKDLFTIDSKTGEIKLNEGRQLDRETQSTFVLIITADDR